MLFNYNNYSMFKYMDEYLHSYMCIYVCYSSRALEVLELFFRFRFYMLLQVHDDKLIAYQ